MNKDIKLEWVKRLRSGTYAQGRNHLAVVDSLGTKSYCCLGVLCEIAVEHKLINTQVSITGGIMFGCTTTMPSAAVRQWAGLEVDELAAMNDVQQANFDVIANFIEKEY